MQIRVAHAGAADPDQYLPRTGRRLRNVLDLSGPTDANKSDSLHGLLLQSLCGPVTLATSPSKSMVLLLLETPVAGWTA
jgi:hypothetical protein